MLSMADAPQEQAAHGDVDHRLGDVEALLIVAHQAAPPDEPADRALDDPPPWHNLEAWIAVEPTNDRDDEAEKGGLVQQRGAVIGAVGKQMLEPRPAFADKAIIEAWTRADYARRGL